MLINFLLSYFGLTHIRLQVATQPLRHQDTKIKELIF